MYYILVMKMVGDKDMEKGPKSGVYNKIIGSYNQIKNWLKTNKNMGEDPKSGVYQEIIGSYNQTISPELSKQGVSPELSEEGVSPELSEEGKQVYLRILGLEKACYNIAKRIKRPYIYVEISGEVRDKIRSIEGEITKDVAKLPEEDHEFIIEELKEDPKALYSAESVIDGIMKAKKVKKADLYDALMETDRVIGGLSELYDRVEASIAYDEGKIGGPGSYTYERAKEAWEKARDSGDLEESPEEDKKFLEEYFSGEKKEGGVRKDLETEVKEGKIGGPGSYTHKRAKEAWEKAKDSGDLEELPEENKKFLEEYFGREKKEEGVRKDVETEAKEESK